jgi:hypothetical protein
MCHYQEAFLFSIDLGQLMSQLFQDYDGQLLMEKMEIKEKERKTSTGGRKWQWVYIYIDTIIMPSC